MKEIEITVTNETGLHSRPADLLVRTSKLYQSDITVKKGEQRINAKAILKVILLNVCQNDTITITADGPDEAEALKDLKRLVETDFTEMNEMITI